MTIVKRKRRIKRKKPTKRPVVPKKTPSRIIPKIKTPNAQVRV